MFNKTSQIRTRSPPEESIVTLVFGSKLYLYRKLILLNMIHKLI